ncbi:MAG TPA: hypothetical protein VM328_11815 [Fimbriimonadaceae bacterium]|nr:hypothetical protein [Fimbriimonadaceae bacterium]
MKLRLGSTFAALLLTAISVADIRYVVTPSAATSSLAIEMHIPVRGDTISVQIPNWAPGSYRLVDHFEAVKNVAAQDEAGRVLTVDHPDANTWTVSAAGSKSVVLRYDLSIAPRGRFPSQPEQEILHYSGPSTYLYVVDRKEEPCILQFRAPSDWLIAVGLDEARERNTFLASDYDVLADNPVTLGKFLRDEYRVHGKPHIIALRGPAMHEVDRKRLIELCRNVTETQAAFFGGLPYNKYVWHFSVNDAVDGAGGLEHLTSTQMTIASGLGPRVISVLSHEFFHLWNVKRIRSKPLGPFDYLVLPKTGALWWLEGVTDYYADVLLVRGGLQTHEQFFGEIVNNVRGVRSNPARLEVSPYEASYRVGEAANGRGNSNGYRVSYYNTGWVLGLVLDLEMRARTGGRRSLDDVMLALWHLTRDGKPGFEEEEIRRQLVRFGGAGMGTLYDEIVMKPGELPVEAALARVGLIMEEHEQSFLNLGLAGAPARDAKGWRVTGASGPAEGKVRQGDIVLSLAGTTLELATNRAIAEAFAKASGSLKPGEPVPISVRREGQVVTEQIVPQAASRKAQRVRPEGSPASSALREAWLKKLK